MSITPIALRIERFRSFSKPQTFNFPTEPGLYLMLGKNEVEPRLAGNGSGKSTIWDALTWLLQERTPSGLKAGDVCTWGEKKGTRVDFEFHEEGAEWCCTRTWGPNTWTLKSDYETIDLANDPQNPLLASLRLSFDAWLCTVVMAQGEDYFLDMPKTKQAALFSSVMELDEWEQRSERASKAADEQDKLACILEGAVRLIDGKLSGMEAMGTQEQANEWEVRQAKRLDQLSREHEDLCQRRKRLREALERAVGDETTAREGLDSGKPDDALHDEYDLVCANVRRHEDKLLKLKVEVNALLEHMAQLDKSGNCPVCGKPFSTHDWQTELKRAERVAEGAKAEATSLVHALDIIKHRRDFLEVEIDKHEDDERARSRALADAGLHVRQARNDLAYCDKELDTIEEQYDAAEREVNPFEQAVKRYERESKGLRKDRDMLERERYDRESQRSIMSMWTRGFKEIRLREIGSALSELEMEVNSAVMSLGLEEWELRFDVDRETKGGAIQKGFAVTVLSPNAGSKAVPWDAWSGGEKQRLRIAGNAGLSDLVRARTGCTFPLEVWDEPTNGLSPEGKVDLFEYLSERARNEGRIVFLLDHQAHDYGGFTGTCTVIKTPSGSRIRQSW